MTLPHNDHNWFLRDIGMASIFGGTLTAVWFRPDGFAPSGQLEEISPSNPDNLQVA
jgi:hypothetical protein